MPVTPTDRRRTRTTRSNPYKAAPELMKAWFALSQQVEKAGIEPDLLELVKIRSSQINGCANCLNMHHAHARKLGEQQKRLDVLSAWREAPWFSDRERAALAWRSEEHTSELQSLMRISYAVFCW